MNIEYEATFINIDKDEVRYKLKMAGAELVRSEFLQKRAVFNLPFGQGSQNSWLRVRDEGDKITMSLKVIDGDQIQNQKEILLKVDDYSEAKKFLAAIGCREKSYQETKREIWELEGVEITIDEWPFLEPLVEIEGASENQVKHVSEKIGFDYTQAKFCDAGRLYHEKYNVSLEAINQNTPKIILKWKIHF